MFKLRKNKYADLIFQFQNIDNKDLLSIFCEYTVTERKVRCSGCNKGIQKGISVAHCCKCQCYFYLKCEKLKKDDIALLPDWICMGCTMKILPFSNINDENMKLANQGLNDEDIEFVLDKCPSFSIKSLLDKMPGQKIDSDQFMSNTIHSKYYTASDFLSAKFSSTNFAIFHLNISSLQKHIDELRSLLTCTNSNFDVICISETRLLNEVPHTPTLTQCGGSQTLACTSKQE